MRVSVAVAIVVALLLATLAANFIASEARPSRFYRAPAEEVYASAVRSLERQGHRPETQPEDVFTSSEGQRHTTPLVKVHFRVKPFGSYPAYVFVMDSGEYSRVTAISGAFPSGILFAWAGGVGEVKKMFAAIDADLCDTDKSKCPASSVR